MNPTEEPVVGSDTGRRLVPGRGKLLTVLACIVCIIIVGAIGSYVLARSHATSLTAAMQPSGDMQVSGVAGVNNAIKSAASLYQDVDDSTSFDTTDNLTTHVKSNPGTVDSYHRLRFSGAPAGTVTQVVVNTRALRSATAQGTLTIRLFDGSTTLATASSHSLSTRWSDFSDTFSGLHVTDASQLNAEVMFHNSASGATGNLAYTVIWMDTSYQPPADTPPSVTITAPANNASVNAGTVAIKGSAGDDKGVTNVDVQIDNGTYQRATGTTSWNYTWNATGLSGSHTIKARATDTLGHTTTASVSVTVVKDTGSHGTGGTVGTWMNWPCPGCITTVPSTYSGSKPTVLLVALHGDEGVPTTIQSLWAPITNQANVILFTPQCPTSLGCRFDDGSGGTTNSWWAWLQYSSTYDDSWIGNQVMSIEHAYDVDLAREYLTGYSGGADYMGWYALQHSERYAAAAFVAGGVPYVGTCPTNRMAAYFLMGTADFRTQSGQPAQVEQVYKNCGYPTAQTMLQGADHQATIMAIGSGYGQTMLNWMMGYRLSSVSSNADNHPSAAGAAPDKAAGPLPISRGSNVVPNKL